MDQRHEGGGGSFCCRCCCFRFFFLFSLVSTHCFLGEEEEEEISVGLTHRGWSSRGRRSGVLRWRWSQSTEPFEKSLTGAAAAGGGGRRAGLEEESGISVPLFFHPSLRNWVRVEASSWCSECTTHEETRGTECVYGESTLAIIATRNLHYL